LTSDRASWTCVGMAPPDATSIGSLDGVVYFGGIEGRIYGFEHASW
jgi:hypothetical protein